MEKSQRPSQGKVRVNFILIGGFIYLFNNHLFVLFTNDGTPTIRPQIVGFFTGLNNYLSDFDFVFDQFYVESELRTNIWATLNHVYPAFIFFGVKDRIFKLFFWLAVIRVVYNLLYSFGIINLSEGWNIILGIFTLVLLLIFNETKYKWVNGR